MHINKQEKYTIDRYNNAIGTKGTFMSNLFDLEYPIVVSINGHQVECWSSEAYYMSRRANDSSVAEQILLDSIRGGSYSRKARKMYQLEMDEILRAQYMIEAVTRKFDSNSQLRELLLQTGTTEIIEKNYWKDDLFGVREDTYTGANILGKCLMLYRDTYINS